MGEEDEVVEDIEDSTSDSFINDGDDSSQSTSGEDDELQFDVCTTEEEIEELIAELLEVESKAAEAQESLEEESLLRLEAEVRQELSENLQGDELEKAVLDEMRTFREEWEAVLDELETESAGLLEQIDAAGISLPDLYKWIEAQAPSNCGTEAWKKRIQWAGSQMTSDVSESLTNAEKYLQLHRPVRRRHGKLLEEGASGFLAKKCASTGSNETVNETKEVEWRSFIQCFSDGLSENAASFGSKCWTSVYLASTPKQAADMGLNFPGIDEVEEIDDVDGYSSDPFIVDAIACKSNPDLSEVQKRNFKKIKEDDDVYADRKLHLRLKRKRLKRRSSKDVGPKVCIPGSSSTGGNLKVCSQVHVSAISDFQKSPQGCESVVVVHQDVSSKVEPDRNEIEDIHRNMGIDFMKDAMVIVDSDNETHRNEENLIIESEASTSGSGSDVSGVEIQVAVSPTRRRKKKIRRILDDAELGEETRKKIAMEKERQDRLRSLQCEFSVNAKMWNAAEYDGNMSVSVTTEVLGDPSSGYVVNVVREIGEEAVRIPPSISAKLKSHQIAGIRFMWENIIQSIRKVKSGDKGLGCILAHTMGLGKTFQVIAFLYTAMRSIDLGLKNALIVTPVNVLHNWKQEFIKWKSVEYKPLRIFMLDDVSRERRGELLAKWRTKGGVLLVGYAAFRNLSLGKNTRDWHLAKEISSSLQDGPDILICDEAHVIKNTKADITQALKLVKCQRRIALTGSPLQNNLMEYYCMVDFVREGFLGSSHEFRNRFQNPIENAQHANSTAKDVKIMNQRSHILYEQLKGFVQRMDMGVVKKDLPSKTVFVITVKLSPLQRKLYRKFLDVHGFGNDKISCDRIRKRSFFAGYQALAQIWNHPGILLLRKEDRENAMLDDVVADGFSAGDSSSDDNVDDGLIIDEKQRAKGEFAQRRNDSGFFVEDWWKDLVCEDNYKLSDNSGKMVLLLDILNMCSDVADKALVFSQSILTLNLIEIYLSKLNRKSKNGKCWRKGKDWYRLDGKTLGSERQKLIEMFNDSSNKRVKCVLISTKAGSLGINLHAANRVVIVDGSWNPTYDLQAIYRAWRYGQTKPVYAYRLLAHGTMEEKIYKRQVTKEGLAARVVDRQQVHRTMSKEEIRHLFDFGDDVLEMESKEEHMATQIHATMSSDKLMQSLLDRHYPMWIANYHEHETLLQENEEDKLSKEEQDMAWEVYRKSLQWEEVHRVHVEESAAEWKHVVPVVSPLDTGNNNHSDDLSKCRFPVRKCTNLCHLLTLRSQGTKAGCTTVCGECAQEISWEDLNRDGRLAKLTKL